MNDEKYVKGMVSTLLGYTGEIDQAKVNITEAERILAEIDLKHKELADLMLESQDRSDLSHAANLCAKGLTTRIGLLTYRLANNLGLDGQEVCLNIRTNENATIYAGLIGFADCAKMLISTCYRQTG